MPESQHDTASPPSYTHGPFYRAGPVFSLGLLHVEETAGDETQADEVPDAGMVAAEEEEAAPGPAPTTSGEGTPIHSAAYARTSLTLRGRTDADFDGGSFRTENVRVRPAQGCAAGDCVRVTGTLVATYHVTTTVTLPSVDDYPDLTPCQRQRVQNAIDNVLAPHEQEHVQAFRQYNGTTRRHFDLTLCRSEFDGRIQEMFEAEESSRRQAAQGASDALDPFNFQVDLDCEDEEQSGSTAPTAQPAEPESQPIS